MDLTRALLLQAGDMDMVEYLLQRGAAPNPTKIAHTALRAASIFGHEQVARRLLEAQADPNLCSLFDRTPLMGAAMNKHPALIRVLLEAKVRDLHHAQVLILQPCCRGLHMTPLASVD